MIFLKFTSLYRAERNEESPDVVIRVHLRSSAVKKRNLWLIIPIAGGSRLRPPGICIPGYARIVLVRRRTRPAPLAARLVLGATMILDATRFRMDFVATMLEDLRWFGFALRQEGSSRYRRSHAPCNQSERRPVYRAALEKKLHAARLDFSPASARGSDVLEGRQRPHEGRRRRNDEPVYPAQFRPPADAPLPPPGEKHFRQPDACARPMAKRFRLLMAASARSAP